MKNKQLLQNVVDNIISEDENVSSILKDLIIEKSKSIVSEMRYKNNREILFLEFTGESPIKLNGDDVTVNGKLVGHVHSDLNDLNSGITFTSVDGRVKKEFEDIESLYAFLSKTFLGENAMTADGVKIVEPKKLDSSDKLDLHKVGTDHDETDELSADGSDTKKTTKLKNLISKIKSGGRETSTSKVVESDWDMENKDVDNDKLYKVKKAVKKMKNKADSMGNK